METLQNPTTLMVEMCSILFLGYYKEILVCLDGLWRIMTYYFRVWRSMMDSQRIHKQWYLHILVYKYPCEIGFSMVQWLLPLRRRKDLLHHVYQAIFRLHLPWVIFSIQQLGDRHVAAEIRTGLTPDATQTSVASSPHGQAIREAPAHWKWGANKEIEIRKTASAQNMADGFICTNTVDSSCPFQPHLNLLLNNIKVLLNDIHWYCSNWIKCKWSLQMVSFSHHRAWTN